jgi:hypothetical protein
VLHVIHRSRALPRPTASREDSANYHREFGDDRRRLGARTCRNLGSEQVSSAPRPNYRPPTHGRLVTVTRERQRTMCSRMDLNFKKFILTGIRSKTRCAQIAAGTG